ncbi:hypothetical protein PHYSODRAFT_262752 [Phytophthora sojae]|uniref:Uncharacterized protein n=1 Tax=Phytophthora sojae (strain P6497) TaxID=1094619 RepID=G5A9N8_PHYSP|nr:hypothetical protein PHYSODRAFT_262752 [Phytophthora sojae]EGZ07318.1 hypothetical protein PHYSODRAFT_262752 [Phytophthora sojae]|eukprot:XP_009536884.1 hypothetical protein PHYSODRAFT_262752 [Phytophthora sojae]
MKRLAASCCYCCCSCRSCRRCCYGKERWQPVTGFLVVACDLLSRLLSLPDLDANTDFCLQQVILTSASDVPNKCSKRSETISARNRVASGANPRAEVLPGAVKQDHGKPVVARYANEVSNYYVDMNYHGVLGRACQVGAELKMQVDSSRVTRRLTRGAP